MKKITISIFTILFLTNIFYSPISYAQKSDELVITIGYCEGYGTIDSNEIKGSRGLGYEYFNEIEKYTKTPITYEYVPVTWEDAFALLETGAIDVFGPVNMTEERAEQFLYPDVPFGTEEMMIAALANEDIELNDYKMMNTSVIGVLDGSATATSLDEYLNKYSITAQTLIIPNIDISLMQRNAYYNLLWISSLQDTNNLKVVAHVSQEPFYYITARDNHMLMDMINNGLAQIQENTPLFFESLYHKYYGNIQDAKPSLSVLNQIAIDSTNVYYVGFAEDHRPFSYVNSKGQPAGIAIDIMNELAADGNFNVEYIALSESTEIANDNLDIILSVLDSHINSPDFDRISEPYLDFPLVVTSPIENSSFEQRRIGYLNYYNLTPEIINVLFPDSIPIEFHSSSDIIDALEKNQIDHMISTSILAEELIISANSHYVMTPVNYELAIPILYSDALSNPQIDAFNKLLQRLDYDKISNCVLSNLLISHNDKSLTYTLYKYRHNIIQLIVTLIFLIILIYIGSHKRTAIRFINTDSLTGLASEYSFIQKATKHLQNHPDEDFSIISLDIDNFNHLKEMYGYDASRRVIKLIGKQLSLCFDDAISISRIGTDLFALMVPTQAITNRCDNKLFCLNHIHDDLEAILGHHFPLHTSIGVYNIEDKNLRLSYMMDCANFARLSGKGIYGKTVVLYTQQMADTRHVKSNVVSNMEDGIANKEFVLCYQPKVDLQTKQIIGAEALVRWKRSCVPPIYPDQFISVFERNGFIVKLDYYVFEEVCAFIARQVDTKLPRISINVSGLTLLEEDFLPKIMAILEKYTISVDAIEIEITESAIIDKFDIVIQKLNLLRDLGISVSMDDFGSGVSSLHRLKDISIDVIKLDKDFLGDTLDAHKGATIIENIIHMSKQLKLKIVAEGIENEEQHKLLADMGCDYGQGYLFSKPLFAEDFLDLI